MSFDFVLSYDASMQNTQASVTDGEQKLNRSSRTFKPSACKLNRGAKAKFRNERDRLRHSRLIIGVTQNKKLMICKPFGREAKLSIKRLSLILLSL